MDVYCQSFRTWVDSLVAELDRIITFVLLQSTDLVYHIFEYNLFLSLCKQTSDLFRWQNLISTCAVHIFKPSNKITK